MKISLSSTFEDFFYTSNVPVGRNFISVNKILKVKVLGDDQFITQIDFTSLPNFHQYTIYEWQRFLHQFFETHKINFSDIQLTLPFFNMVSLESTSVFNGELLFIIESILFAVIEKKANHLLIKSDSPIKINGLYSNDLTTKSPECLKIKIRPTKSSLDETLLILKDLIARAPQCQIRLDGNRSFELRELLLFMKFLESQLGMKILREKIEYIEEPFKNSYDFFTFKNIYPYLIALDESLINYKDNLTQLKTKNPNFLILKPSLLGLSKSFEIIELFPNICIISASFETFSAIRPLLYLASLLPNTFHGLDTLKYLPNEYGTLNENYSIIL